MGAVTGGLMAIGGAALGAKESSDARKANEAERDASLRFQAKQMWKSLGELKAGYKGSQERMAGQMEADRRNLLAGLARGGWSDTSTVGLGAQRGQAMDFRNALAALHTQYRGSRAAVFQGQEYPMIQYQPSGAGAALAGAGMQMASTAMMMNAMNPGQTQINPSGLGPGGMGPAMAPGHN